MLKPYNMITKCQTEISNSELPKIDRLQFEMLLLRVKLALLDHGKDGDDLEKEIKYIYDQICSLCSQGSNTKDAKRIATRLQNLAEGLKKPLDLAEKE